MPILLVSGGLDSFISWKVLDEPPVLFIDYGQPYLEKELKAIKLLYPERHEIKIPNLPPLGKQIHVPARNLLFATIAVRFSNRIFLGGVKDELCSDKSPSAFQSMSNILTRHSNYQVTVDSPIWRFTKAEAVAHYQNKGFPAERLLGTISCYSPGEEPCNNCESCFRRFVALASNGIIESHRLPHDDIITQFIRKIHIQPTNRKNEIVRALKNADIPIRVTTLSSYRPLTQRRDYTIIISDRPESDRQKLSECLPHATGLLLGQVIPLDLE